MGLNVITRSDDIYKLAAFGPSWGVSAVGISTVALLWSIWQPKFDVRAKKAIRSRIFEPVIVLSPARMIYMCSTPPEQGRRELNSCIRQFCANKI
jgi:hypothetical protein